MHHGAPGSALKFLPETADEPAAMPDFATFARRAARSLLWLSMAAALTAQEYRFQFHGIAEGLTNLAIKGMYQDHKGFLWVSTENGVFRYDGERFQLFGVDSGLPATAGVAFGEAPDGNLLAGSERGLYRLIGNSFERVALPGASSANQTGVSWMGGIKSDGRGKTWLATDRGLMLLGVQGAGGTVSIRSLRSPPGVSGPATQGILVEPDAVWYGCGLELCRLNEELVSVYGKPQGLPPAAWIVIGRERNGDLWVRGKGIGVAVLRRGAARFEVRGTPLLSTGVTGMPGVDSEGHILLPAADGLVIGRDGAWRKIGRAAGLRGAVYAVLQDREGSLWIGLAGRGLARWLGYGEWEAYTTDSGLGSDLVYEILPQPDGTVWAGTESGLAHGSRLGEAYTWRKDSRIGDTPVHSVRSDPQGMLWLGTETRGAARLNPATGAVDWIGGAQGLDAKSPYTLAIDSHRRIWAATENGLFVADLPFRRFRRVEELPRSRFWTVTEAANGDIWAGGSAGLYHLAASAAGDVWERLTTAQGLSHQEVLSLGAAPNGDMWVGYRFGGEIDRIDSVRRPAFVAHITQRQPGGAGLAYFLGFDARGRLWAGTERGVDVLEENRWIHLDTSDGLAWDDCDLNGFAAEPDGTVWIGTSGGLARFSPHPRPATPAWQTSVVFTRLTLGDREAVAADHPSVDYRSNQLIARFSALNFAHAGTLEFRYRLQPLFTEWRTTERRELEFPGLPSGAYHLEIQARDRSGAWSEEPAAFGFAIRPPWFLSWWFLGIGAVTPLLFVIGGIRLRTAVHRHRERDLMDLVAARTADLQKANADLLRLSSVDGLTGVANRRAFDQALKREWANMMRTGDPLSLLLLDVDHFKLLNDTRGHQYGDECLMLLASELQQLTRRETDLVARYGGEEFAIVLPRTDRADAGRFAESLRAGIAGMALGITVSIGVATAIRGSFANLDGLIEVADHGLYAAKRRGRNRVASAQETLSMV